MVRVRMYSGTSLLQLSTIALLFYTTEVENQCLVPKQPVNGQYELLASACGLESGTRNTVEGVAVPRDCVLSYSCNEGYEFPPSVGEVVVNAVCNITWSPPIEDITCLENKIPETPATTATTTHTNNDDDTKYFPTSTSLSEDSSAGCSIPQDTGYRLFCPYNCTECSLNPYDSCFYFSSTHKVQAIRIQCIPGYGLNNREDNAVAICISGKWIPSFPACQKVCPALDSESLQIRCIYGSSEVNCSRPMVPGTSASYRCKQSHREYSSLAEAGVYGRTLVCGRNGRWSRGLPECEPICGVSKGNASLTPSIVNGQDTKLGVFPWHVGLYRRNNSTTEIWENICGGSLLTNRVILTAAHCVFSLSPEDLKVAMGKYYSSWLREDPDEVRRDIAAIKLPTEYKGAATSYTWDIALLLMKESVQFNSFVMPVCRDPEAKLHISKEELGYVVGWGKTSPDDPVSETLLHNTVSIMDDSECRRKIPRFLSFDKFCGFKNSVSTVQKGDSGGGLTATVGGLHYVFGIISIKFSELSLFTNVSWDSHKRWLDNEMLHLETIH